jgi:hypothetical protein
VGPVEALDLANRLRAAAPMKDTRLGRSHELVRIPWRALLPDDAFAQERDAGCAVVTTNSSERVQAEI